MKRLRSLLALGSTLLLLISACSQPEDLASPNLTPQYGTSQDDSGSVVTNNTAGQVFVLGSRGFYDENSLNTRWNTLTRFDSTGKQRWSQTLGQACNGTADVCSSRAYSANTDQAGNVYVVYGYSRDYGFDATLKKFDASGKLLWTKLTAAADFGAVAAATSRSGEAYVARELQNLGQNETERRLLKFSASGQKIFEKPSIVANPNDAVVAADGSLYVTGKGTLVKYSSAGNLVWQKALPATAKFSEIAVSGSNVYVAFDTKPFERDNQIAFYRFTTAGSLTKQIIVRVPKFTVLNDLSLDAQGNAYLAGSVIDGSGAIGSRNRFVRKINTSGSSSWTYNPSSVPDDVFSGVTAGISGQIYLTGTTDGQVNGVNRGGYDAFLMRLNPAGQVIWQR